MTGTIPPLPARIGQRSIVASKGTWWSKFRIDKLHRPWGGMENKVNERRTRAKISAGELAVRAGMFEHDIYAPNRTLLYPASNKRNEYPSHSVFLSRAFSQAPALCWWDSN